MAMQSWSYKYSCYAGFSLDKRNLLFQNPRDPPLSTMHHMHQNLHGTKFTTFANSQLFQHADRLGVLKRQQQALIHFRIPVERSASVFQSVQSSAERPKSQAELERLLSQ